MSEEGGELAIDITDPNQSSRVLETTVKPVAPKKELVVEPEPGTVQAEIKVVALDQEGIGEDSLEVDEKASKKASQEEGQREQTEAIVQSETVLKAEISQTFRKVFQLTNKLLDMVEGALQRRIMLSDAEEILGELEEEIRTLAKEIQLLTREFGSDVIPPLIGIQLKLHENMLQTIRTAHARAKDGRKIKEVEAEPDPLQQIQEELTIVWQGDLPGVELHVRRERQGGVSSGQLISELRSEGSEGQKLVFTEMALAG
jgi:hypothetical protein